MDRIKDILEKTDYYSLCDKFDELDPKFIRRIINDKKYNNDVFMLTIRIMLMISELEDEEVVENTFNKIMSIDNNYIPAYLEFASYCIYVAEDIFKGQMLCE